MGTIADTLVDIRIKNNDVYVQLKHILKLYDFSRSTLWRLINEIALHILKLYDFSRSTLWRLINEMRLIPKYKKAFRDVSPQKKLVHLASFEEFIQYKHQKYMKD